MQIYFATASTLSRYARRVAQLLAPEYTVHPWFDNCSHFSDKPEKWERLATENTDAIRAAHSVYAFVDTWHPSMGTMFEVGLAQGLGKLRKIFGYDEMRKAGVEEYGFFACNHEFMLNSKEVRCKVDIGTVSKAEEEAGFKYQVEAVSQAIAKSIRAQEDEYLKARMEPKSRQERLGGNV